MLLLTDVAEICQANKVHITFSLMKIQMADNFIYKSIHLKRGNWLFLGPNPIYQSNYL